PAASWKPPHRGRRPRGGPCITSTPAHASRHGVWDVVKSVPRVRRFCCKNHRESDTTSSRRLTSDHWRPRMDQPPLFKWFHFAGESITTGYAIVAHACVDYGRRELCTVPRKYLTVVGRRAIPPTALPHSGTSATQTGRTLRILPSPPNFSKT